MRVLCVNKTILKSKLHRISQYQRKTQQLTIAKSRTTNHLNVKTSETFVSDVRRFARTTFMTPLAFTAE